MKQLHKQSGGYRREDDLPTAHSQPYSPKALKHSNRSLPKAISYILREQRLLFIVIGILIAYTFFVLQPSLSRLSTSESKSAANSVGIWSGDQVSSAGRNGGSYGLGKTGRVPVGIGRRRMRIVVTGGAGFVGSHLVDRLMARGDDVIVIDNFFTGRKENVMHHFENPRFELLRHDVVEPILLEVDKIYHLACPASPVHYKFNPVKTIITFLLLIVCSFDWVVFSVFNLIVRNASVTRTHCF